MRKRSKRRKRRKRRRTRRLIWGSGGDASAGWQLEANAD